MTDSADDLERRRQELRERLLAEAGIEPVGTAPIPRRDPAASLVLTEAQRRLWFLDQLEDDPTGLNVRAAIRVRGALDPDQLTGVLATIVARHDVLRWGIANRGGTPTLVELDDPRIRLIVDDRSDVEHQDAIDATIAAAASSTFDLASEVPVAVHVTRLGPDDHVLAATMHHIVSDAQSIRNLAQELLNLWAGASGHGDPTLPEPAVEFLDYAAWHVAEVERTGASQVDYWEHALADLPPTSDLPADHPRVGHQIVNSGSARRRLDGLELAGLRAVASSAQATLFMALLAAHALALAVANGQRDVAIGTPVAGRSRPESEAMLGVFINTIVLRLKVDASMSFRDALDVARTTCFSGFEHQDVPFEHVLERLQPPREPGRTPLFSTLFNMTVAPPSIESGLPLDIEPIRLEDLEAKFDVTLYADDGGDAIDLLAVYNRDLYEPATVDGFVDRIVEILRAGGADPDAPIAGVLGLATEPDHTAPLEGSWPGSAADAVARHAAATPDRTALLDDATAWSFAELDRDARRIAARLHDAGAVAGEHVAIIGDRCAALGPAVIGALRAATPYVIIDPATPYERIERYLEIVGPAAYIVVDGPSGAATTTLAAMTDVVTLRIGPTPDDIDPAWDALDFEEPTITETTAACLTFTSGSTGSPKAVVGAHGSLTAFLPWMSDEFGIGADDRFSLLSGLAHDPIQRDLLWALCAGATVVAPDPNRMAEPGYLAQWLGEREITVAHLTPAMGSLVVETAKVESLPALRRTFFIGDRLTGTVVSALDSLAPTAEIINLYGTTETQRASGWYRLTPDDRADARPGWVAPLGHPMPGSALLLVSEDGTPAPPGAAGEVVMRSPWLALGYLGPDGLETDAFSDAPSREGANERAYRTGDLASRRPDGALEHRGRVDDQLKIRGFRVEPRDVERTLESRPEIDRCAVVVIDRETPRIGAYVIAADGSTLDSGDVVSIARDLLPPAMIPSVIDVVDAVPLTANGKIDATPLRVVRAAVGGHAPTDDLERQLLGLWGEVLGRRDLGVHDDFFAAGGFSLLATRLFARIDEEIGVTLPVALLFTAPTVSTLAERIRRLQAGDESVELRSVVAIKGDGDRRPLFYVMPYTISVLQLSTLGELVDAEQPLYGIQPLGLEPGQEIHTSVEQMAEAYLAEIREVQPEGPYAFGGHCAGSIVAFEMARQIEETGGVVSSLIVVDQGPPRADRPKVVGWRYVLHRVRFFARSGRLRHALEWQLRLLSGRLLLRRVGSVRQRRHELVRANHRNAHSEYQGGSVDAPIFLLRSEETIALGDRDWHLQWREHTSGRFASDTVSATHAMLLERPYVEELADKFEQVLGPAAAD